LIKAIIVLSGQICTGKSTLADELVGRKGFSRISTSQLIREAVKTGTKLESRADFQKQGRILDKKKGPIWLTNALFSLLENLQDPPEYVVVDSLRLKEQVDAFRVAYGAKVKHIHLTADSHRLESRFNDRDRDDDRGTTFEQSQEDVTEAQVKDLQKFADVRIDTGLCGQESIYVRALAGVGLYRTRNNPVVDVLIGGQYGSEGKGHIAAYMAPEYDVLIRVGGPNAGHSVYEEPKPIKFHHLPSGSTRNREALVLLGPGSVISPEHLLEEIGKFHLDPSRLVIDKNAMIIVDSDRNKEKKLSDKIGSTGQGVGSATSRKVLRSLASPKVVLAKDHPDLTHYIGDTVDRIESAYSTGKKIMLEGTQGTSLSLHHGPYPWVTSRDTTVSGCMAEAGIAPGRVRKVIMVCRTYPIRVESPEGGTSGPMSNELNPNSWQIVAERSGIALSKLLETEKTTTTQRGRRVAEFDWDQLRRSSVLNCPTDLAISFTDYHTIENQKARRYEQLSDETRDFIDEVEGISNARVSLISTRFHYRGIIDRRLWT